VPLDPLLERRTNDLGLSTTVDRETKGTFGSDLGMGLTDWCPVQIEDRIGGLVVLMFEPWAGGNLGCQRDLMGLKPTLR